MNHLLERFLAYVKVDTQSDPESCTTPSSAKQLVLAQMLYDELKRLGVEDVTFDRERGYLYASVPSNLPKEQADAVPAIGFIAHMDTSPDMSGANVKPRVITDYDGTDIVLNEEQQIILSASEDPLLASYKGKTLIVTDGTTLLGADDKAGVAEIMTAVEEFLTHPEIPHGEIKIGFTPDEEVGRGADYFDVEGFGAKYAYTIDGGHEGEIEYENFNAASVNIEITGRSIHPGSAKDRMINAAFVAAEIMAQLPEEQTPQHTEGYEGFYHLTSIKGNVESAKMHFIIRDHDRELFEQKKAGILAICEKLNQKYVKGTVLIDIKDSYYNMKELIEPHMHLIDNAKEAMLENGVTPLVVPIRGGTDGARLSYMGLPCPNLYTGGHNYHGRYEYACLESMQSMVSVIMSIVGRYAEGNK